MQTDKAGNSAEQLQENNASGANKGEQGRASFTTGSTTQGGSNYGQGSSHLGAESYQQGNSSNEGTNYANEKDRLGNSTTGTSEEGSSSANAGMAGGIQNMASLDTGRTQELDRNGQEGAEELKEGDRRDTQLEDDTSLGVERNESRSSGSWSAGTIDQ